MYRAGEDIPPSLLTPSPTAFAHSLPPHFFQPNPPRHEQESYCSVGGPSGPACIPD